MPHSIREILRRGFAGATGQTTSEYVIALGAITLPVLAAIALLSNAAQRLIEAAADFFS